MGNTQKIGVVGAGSWGTAVAQLLATKNYPVTVWAREAELVEGINSKHENPLFHPGVELSANLKATSDLAGLIKASEIIVIGVPTQYIRAVLTPVKDQLTSDKTWISIAKGIETTTLLTVTQILCDIQPQLDSDALAVLSGPSFAEEVMHQQPTAVSLACSNEKRLATLQSIFHAPHFRTYSSQDVLGVELGGALKNVVAIGVGIAEGLGFGHNARAAMITRAIAEISRLAMKMGAKPQTLSGLAGTGDLILTCTGSLSRNRSFGIEIAKGKKLDDVLANTKMVVEGVYTARSAYELAKKHNVEMPIVEQMYLTLHEGKSPTDALRDLMARDPKEEFY
jgi:glycerol-3-phosphate dehydrogenase (NAD(P)+)